MTGQDLNTLNEHGIPLHACNGYRCDEHRWAWLRWTTETGVGPLYDWLRSIEPGKPVRRLADFIERKAARS